jgi:hypothetical protein
LKVAVCVSGLIEGNYVKRNNVVLKEKFPYADFYYATWKTEEKNFKTFLPDDECFFFDEPEINYHPYATDWKQWKNPHILNYQKWAFADENLNISSRSTKQILIHALLFDKIKKKYDVIIRTRFDAFALKDDLVNFNHFVNETFEKNIVCGFSSSIRSISELDKLRELEVKNKNKRILQYSVGDILIIHPSSAIDVKTVMKLHETKQLRGAELGWWQILCDKSNYEHKVFAGWIGPDKHLNKVFLKQS